MRKSLVGLDLASIIQYFDARPEFGGKGKGARDDQIARLEEKWKIPLHPDYLVFLKRFGADHSPLFPSKGIAYGLDSSGHRTENHFPLHYDFTIATRLSGKKRILGKGIDRDGLKLIGTQSHSEDGGWFYIDMREKTCGAAPVVNVDTYGEENVISVTFKEFVLDYGFLKKGRF